MASRVLGVARETVIAYLSAPATPWTHSTSRSASPTCSAICFAEGAISAAFVPTFTRTLAGRGRDAAWRLGNLVINALVVVTLACVIAGWFFAPHHARAGSRPSTRSSRASWS